jgi:UDP-N-acetyl-D-glucosamine/UDP-N-acetyl-D-galactosamine dehydrogenase
MNAENMKIAIIGLGYVGLPLAVEFAKHYPVVGFDISELRISELKKGHDFTREVPDEAMKSAVDSGLTVTSDEAKLTDSNIFIVTVPTPVDRNNNPDFSPLISASELVGRHINKGDYVIYESTVYPGATEEVCVPIVEAGSDMIFNTDFYVGFSPERINPGDKVNTLTTIKKVTSGSTEEAAKIIDGIYKSIITAGTHMAESIKVAEASKVIENTQRDVNIAFANEISKIFDLLGINTQQVLTAAGTKWNFLKFSPGLVGGHCIGVDPYYLVHKAQQHGYSPNVLLQSRLVNESMGEFVADKVIKLMCENRVEVVGSKVLILGFSFKENCPDLRNTKVIDIINGLKGYHCQVDIVDPWVDAEEAYKEYDLKLNKTIIGTDYSAIVIAVNHSEFKVLDAATLRKHMNNRGIIYDVKGGYDANEVEGQL